MTSEILTLMPGSSGLRAWIGRQETMQDVASRPTIVRLCATLNQTVENDVLPPLAHWLYFLPTTKTEDLDADGHPRLGGFLPPVDLPRRMWAGGRIAFRRPISIGDTIARRSTILDVAEKDGRSGRLVFVVVRHEIVVGGDAAIVEEQDIVYREAAASAPASYATPPSSVAPSWRRRVDPSSTLLFRYSALTFNSHRIHYDQSYARKQEGYPNIVVHGPLIATMLADSVQREVPGFRMARFGFRALRPLFAEEPFYVCGRVESEELVRLWAEAADGSIATTATAEADLAEGS